MNVSHQLFRSTIANYRRRGAATLELVLSLPILLALIVGVVWLGNSVVAQTEVTVEARHKTWEKRSETTGTALMFLKDDITSDEATKTVDVSPVFDDVEPPESSHDVMAADWDFEVLPLDKAPNWKEYAIAAANAKTGSIQNGYVDARNQFTRFKSDASNVWKSIAAALIKQITGLGDLAKSQLENGESAGAGEKAQLRSQLRSSLSKKTEELKQARKALRDLDDEASDSLKKVLKNRVERLRSEIDDLKADLKAMDD